MKKIIVGILGSLFLTMVIVGLVPNSTFAGLEPPKCAGLMKAHDNSPAGSPGHLKIYQQLLAECNNEEHEHGGDIIINEQ